MPNSKKRWPSVEPHSNSVGVFLAKSPCGERATRLQCFSSSVQTLDGTRKSGEDFDFAPAGDCSGCGFFGNKRNRYECPIGLTTGLEGVVGGSAFVHPVGVQGARPSILAADLGRLPLGEGGAKLIIGVPARDDGVVCTVSPNLSACRGRRPLREAGAEPATDMPPP